MRRFQLISAVLILFLAAPAFAQEWIEYVDRNEHFQINFPGQPTVREITYDGENDEALPAKVYTAKEGPATYTLTVVNYKDSETIAGAGGYRGAAAYAIWKFMQRGGKVTYFAFSLTDLIRGLQLQMTNPDSTRSYIAVYPHMRRLYIMEGNAPADYPPPSDFPQTLQVLDDQGKRIRYELDDEGNRVGRRKDARRAYEGAP